MKPNPPLLRAEALSIAFASQGVTKNQADAATRQVVCDASFSLGRGEVMAIVGESGSGKTMLARAILGLLPAGGFVSNGSLYFDGQDLGNIDLRQWQAIRGQKISMIFQEPMVSLNPTLGIGFQLCEAMRRHTELPYQQIWQRAIELLTRVRIQDPEACMQKYPHEFSGGMRQRIMIASSLMLKPQLLIADEPTTALDCIVQRRVLDILLDVTRDENTAVLLITHDLGLVAHYADKVLVMEQGKTVEQGDVKNILENPTHPYTRKLLSSLPHKIERTEPVEDKSPLVSIKNLSVDYPIRRRWFWQKQQSTRVLHDINVDMQRGETLAIVGESGSGKTTLGRAILQLTDVAEGSITVAGIPVTGANAPGLRAMSDIVQLVFQDPYASLSPRQSIGKSIAEPLLLKNALSRGEIKNRTTQILKEVGLPADYYDRYPNELSGGQRQRVSIARALINNPKLIIADEPVSALDITVQAQILALLDQLKQKHGFSCIFISHDLGVVEQIADRIIVLLHGRIVEWGAATKLLANPAHPYTQELLAALPELQAKGEHCYQLHTRHHREYPLPEGYVPEGYMPEGYMPEGYVHEAENQVTDTCYLKLSDNHHVACRKI